MAHYKVHVRRVYEAPEADDGARVLVDRVCPRGLRKESAGLDDWVKDVAPSTELRKWYDHDPIKFNEFRDRYCRELDAGRAHEGLERLRALANQQRVTLLTATREVAYSQATVLAELL